MAAARLGLATLARSLLLSTRMPLLPASCGADYATGTVTVIDGGTILV